jgi:hypothetical protein
MQARQRAITSGGVLGKGSCYGMSLSDESIKKDCIQTS